LISIAFGVAVAAFTLALMSFAMAIYAVIETRAAQKSTHTMIGGMAPVNPDRFQSQEEFDRAMAEAEDGYIKQTLGDDDE